MKINLENYEAFLLDYSEGNLNKADVKSLLDFLQAHPHLNTAAEALGSIEINADATIRYPHKNSLKKAMINEKNDAEFMIGRMEGDLSEEENIKLDEYLFHNKTAQSNLELFKKTRLMADEKVSFKNKKNLKKGVLIFSFPVRSALAAAASLLIIIGIYFFLNSNSSKLWNVNSLADLSKKSIPTLPSAKQTDTLTETKQQTETVAPKHTLKTQKLLKTNKINKSELVQEERQFTKKEILSEQIMLSTNSIPISSPKEMPDLETLPINNAVAEVKTISTDISPDEDDVSLLETIASAVKMNIRRAVKNKKIKEKAEENGDESSPSVIWNLAEAGTQTVKLLTRTNVAITRTANTDDTSERISFVAGQFEFASDKQK